MVQSEPAPCGETRIATRACARADRMIMREVRMNHQESAPLHHRQPAAPGSGNVGACEAAARQMSALLRTNMGFDVCLRCIRTALRLDPDAAQGGMALLASNTAYRHERWICARCRRVDEVIRAVR